MYEELVKQCQNCLDSLCGECKYEHLQKAGNFVRCMNALLGEATNAIESLSSLVDHYGGETGIKNLEEYADKYWEIVKNEKVGEQYNKAYAEEYCNAHPFL